MYKPTPTSIIQAAGFINCIEKSQVAIPLRIKPVAIKICAIIKALKLFFIKTKLATSIKTMMVTGISVCINTADWFPNPSSFQISAAKLSLISLKMVSIT